MEDVDLSVVLPTLSTPDLERRDVTSTQEKTKKEGPGWLIDHHVMSSHHSISCFEAVSLTLE